MTDTYKERATMAETIIAQTDEAEFELHCNGDYECSASGPRDRAWAEIQHYAAQYRQDGPVVIYEVTRRPVADDGSPLPPSPESKT